MAFPFKKPNKKSAGGSSVVGTSLRGLSGKIHGRGVPKGGLPSDGLEVDESVMGASRGKRLDGGKLVRILIIVVSVLAILLIVGVVGVSALSRTSAFQIEHIDAAETEHVSAQKIAQLAAVEKGATLLNVDTDRITQNLRRNPWVGTVVISREFPDTLKVTVVERKIGYVVVMSSGNMAWYLGADNVWVEPVRVDVADGLSTADAALGIASSMGAVLVSDVPSSVSPVAGSECTDESILAVESLQGQFPDDFAGQVASYSAPSADALSCTLSSGVEVSLGTTANADSKESAVRQILSTYQGQISFINVRAPAKPTYRRLDSQDIQQGTGAAGTSSFEADGTNAFTSTISGDDTMVDEDGDGYVDNYTSLDTDGDGYADTFTLKDDEDSAGDGAPDSGDASADAASDEAASGL
jgi:cell division protein FtsQ